MNTPSRDPTTCPFCPLRCQDLVVELSHGTADQALDVKGCQRAATARQEMVSVRQRFPLNAPDEAALHRAVQLMGKARTVIVAGSAEDMQTARAMVRLAAKLRGQLWLGSQPSGSLLASVIERNGTIGATLGEVATRSDSVVLLGNVIDRYPRLTERFLTSNTRDGLLRRVLWLNTNDDDRTLPSHWERISVKDGRLAEFFSLVLLHRAQKNDAYASADARAIIEWLNEGQYISWVTAASEFDAPAYSVLTELNNQLNVDRRSVLVPIQEDASGTNTALWLSGFAGGVDFSSGLAQPLESCIGDSSAVTVWVHPFPTASEPHSANGPLIVVGTPGVALRQRADVVLDTAVPGVEAYGTTLRGDGTIALAWSPPYRSSDNQRSRWMLNELMERLMSARYAP